MTNVEYPLIRGACKLGPGHPALSKKKKRYTCACALATLVGVGVLFTWQNQLDRGYEFQFLPKSISHMMFLYTFIFYIKN